MQGLVYYLWDFTTIYDAVVINSGTELADNDLFNTKCEKAKARYYPSIDIMLTNVQTTVGTD